MNNLINAASVLFEVGHTEPINWDAKSAADNQRVKREWNKLAQPLEALPHPCYCVGPQNGDPECPCAMRAKKKNTEWLEGFEAGKKYAQSLSSQPHKGG